MTAKVVVALSVSVEAVVLGILAHTTQMFRNAVGEYSVQQQIGVLQIGDERARGLWSPPSVSTSEFLPDEYEVH